MFWVLKNFCCLTCVVSHKFALEGVIFIVAAVFHPKRNLSPDCSDKQIDLGRYCAFDFEAFTPRTVSLLEGQLCLGTICDSLMKSII